MELGDLKEINIRDIWKHELEFSQWLADEENINKLGKALDITFNIDQIAVLLNPACTNL